MSCNCKCQCDGDEVITSTTSEDQRAVGTDVTSGGFGRGYQGTQPTPGQQGKSSLRC